MLTAYRFHRGRPLWASPRALPSILTSRRSGLFETIRQMARGNQVGSCRERDDQYRQALYRKVRECYGQRSGSIR